MTSESMREFFSQFGKVVDATVMLDRETGRSKGFGFVSFEGANVEPILGFGNLEIDGKLVCDVVELLIRCMCADSITYDRSTSSSLNHGHKGKTLQRMARRKARTRVWAPGSEIRLRSQEEVLLLPLPPQERRQAQGKDRRSTLRLLHRCIHGCSSRWAV